MIDNLNDLKYFMEVAKTGNITRASERLGVTQPTLTLALQRLEQQMGIKLLDRSRQGSYLTRQGSELMAKAQILLEMWERELRSIAHGAELLSGKYVLGAHTSVARYALKLFLSHALKEYPQLELSLMHDLSRKITEKIISRECDLGLVINPVPHPDLVIVPLLNDRVTLFKHPTYNGDVLILDPELKQTQALLKSVRKVFEFRRELHSSSLEVIAELCANKCGAALLPARVAALTKGPMEVAGAPVFRDELSLVYRMERKKEKGFQLLVKTIKENVK
jgi:LysR family transcriptional regulator, cell division regulator